MALHRGNVIEVLGEEAGFTLMELIIVCTLAGLLLSISIPTLRNTLVINKLDTAARKIIGTVKELRHKAVRDHKAYVLHFDLGQQQYWYELDGKKNPFNEEPETLSKLPEGIAIRDVQTASQGTQNSGKVSLWISSKGYMDQTMVHLSDDDGKTLTLSFSPFSGSARVYEEYVQAER